MSLKTKTQREHKTDKGCVTLWPCHLQRQKTKKERIMETLKYFTMQKYT
jgi:hypothetical protein